MARHPYFLLDVFTDTPLAGNQLAVFPDADAIHDDQLLPLARELNLSETVFLYPPREGGHRRMRIFTSDVELPFAGHPVLGTACLLVSEFGHEGVVNLETGRGIVQTDTQLDQTNRFTGSMIQPFPTIRKWDRTGELLEELGLEASVVPVELYDNGVPHLYVMYDSVDQVEQYQPDFSALRRLLGGPCLNCFAGSEGSYVSRMFAPFDRAMPEDPACGSAAGPLALHLVRHGIEDSNARITISQGAQVGRPSTLYASAELEGVTCVRVSVGGHAVLLAEGVMRLP